MVFEEAIGLVEIGRTFPHEASCFPMRNPVLKGICIVFEVSMLESLRKKLGRPKQ